MSKDYKISIKSYIDGFPTISKTQLNFLLSFYLILNDLIGQYSITLAS